MLVFTNNASRVIPLQVSSIKLIGLDEAIKLHARQ
jgi:hypothetical protein